MKTNTLTADKILSEKQAKILFKELAREKDNSVSTGKNLKFINDYYAIYLAYNTGLRISELLSLKWEHIQIQNNFLIVARGKGGKSRTVFFGKMTELLITEFKEIQESIFTRKCEPGNYLFIGQRGPLQRCALHLRFKYWIERLGLPQSLSFHSLRHGFSTRLLNNGVPLQSVRDQLGHSNISITSTYLHFTEDAKEKLMKVL